MLQTMPEDKNLCRFPIVENVFSVGTLNLYNSVLQAKDEMLNPCNYHVLIEGTSNDFIFCLEFFSCMRDVIDMVPQLLPLQKCNCRD